MVYIDHVVQLSLSAASPSTADSRIYLSSPRVFGVIKMLKTYGLYRFHSYYKRVTWENFKSCAALVWQLLSASVALHYTNKASKLLFFSTYVQSFYQTPDKKLFFFSIWQRTNKPDLHLLFIKNLASLTYTIHCNAPACLMSWTSQRTLTMFMGVVALCYQLHCVDRGVSQLTQK